MPSKTSSALAPTHPGPAGLATLVLPLHQQHAAPGSRPVLDFLLGSTFTWGKSELAHLADYLCRTKFPLAQHAAAVLKRGREDAEIQNVKQYLLKQKVAGLESSRARVEEETTKSEKNIEKLLIPFEKFADPIGKLCAEPETIEELELVVDAANRVLIDHFYTACGTAFEEMAASPALRDITNKILLRVAQRVLLGDVGDSSKKSVRNSESDVGRIFPGGDTSIVLQVSKSHLLYVFMHGGKFHAAPLSVETFLHGEAYCQHDMDPLRLAAAVPNNHNYYEWGARIVAERGRCGRGGGVIEGAHLRVNWVSGDVIQHFSPGIFEDMAAFGVKRFLPKGDPAFGECMKRVCVEKGEVLFVQKFYGLTHPEFPFAQSKRVFPVLDKQTISEMKKAIDVHIGQADAEQFDQSDNKYLRLMTGHVVPFSFPPMLPDEERMARNLCALGAPFGSEAEAEKYFAERLQEMNVSAKDLPDFPTEGGAEAGPDFPPDFSTDPVLVRAKQMAEKALRALKEAELAEEALREEAKRADLIKREQERIAVRWDKNLNVDAGGGEVGGGAGGPGEKMGGSAGVPVKMGKGQKKKVKSKSQKKKDAKEKGEMSTAPKTALVWMKQRHADTKSRFKAILQNYAGKVAKLRHYHKGLRALSKVQGIDLELQHGSHKVLHARDMPALTIPLPHGRTAEKAVRALC